MVPMDGEMVNSHLCTPVSHSNLLATNRDSQPYFRYNLLLGIACVAYLWDFFFFFRKTSHSSLFQWGNSASPSVFYQTLDNSIHEMKYDGRDWNDTAFVQPGAMPSD
jgi:hypothetical protein